MTPGAADLLSLRAIPPYIWDIERYPYICLYKHKYTGRRRGDSSNKGIHPRIHLVLFSRVPTITCIPKVCDPAQRKEVFMCFKMIPSTTAYGNDSLRRYAWVDNII